MSTDEKDNIKVLGLPDEVGQLLGIGPEMFLFFEE